MFSSLLSRISSSIPAPFLSISSTLQRNILSFLLKRTLGHLIKGGQLDLNQIESGIGAGRVELRGVELDPQVSNHKEQIFASWLDQRETNRRCRLCGSVGTYLQERKEDNRCILGV